MITLYCHGQQHGDNGQLCADCQSLSEYVSLKLQRCPFGEDKPTCLDCTVHCYQPDRREHIRQVMRYAGPRMLLHHPYLAVMHLIDGLQKPSEG